MEKKYDQFKYIIYIKGSLNEDSHEIIGYWGFKEHDYEDKF